MAAAVSVPDLHFAEHIGEIDHDWHEISGFESTDEPPTDLERRSIEEFIESLRAASGV